MFTDIRFEQIPPYKQNKKRHNTDVNTFWILSIAPSFKKTPFLNMIYQFPSNMSVKKKIKKYAIPLDLYLHKPSKVNMAKR